VGQWVDLKMNYYWVNQGRTWRDEYEGGFLWAPLRNDAGRSVWHWDTMDGLQIGDFIFSYVRGKIVSVSKVRTSSYRSEKPEGFRDWQRDGRKCDVIYKVLQKPINISNELDNIVHLLPNTHSPLQNNGRANQIYLTKINQELGHYLIQFFPAELLVYDSVQVGDTENIDQSRNQNSSSQDRRTITVEVTRVIRDTRLSKEIKQLYDYKCQICGITINSNTVVGKYAEGAHIKPLAVDIDTDKKDNIICLCPNHHTMLDYGAISIKDDYSLIGIDGTLYVKHRLNKDNFKYHRENIFNKFND
jgi:hypothetical protein